MSTLRVNNLTDTSGTAANLGIPGAAKAWVNFNGSGTVAIRESFNVSSITDNGTGLYTINFTNALDNNNYIIVGSMETGNATPVNVQPYGSNGDSMTTNSVAVSVAYLDGTIVLVDITHGGLAVFAS